MCKCKSRYKIPNDCNEQFIKVFTLFSDLKVHWNNVKTTLNEQQLQSQSKSDGNGKFHSTTKWIQLWISALYLQSGREGKVANNKTGVNWIQIDENAIWGHINYNKSNWGEITNELLDIFN